MRVTYRSRTSGIRRSLIAIFVVLMIVPAAGHAAPPHNNRTRPDLEALALGRSMAPAGAVHLSKKGLDVPRGIEAALREQGDPRSPEALRKTVRSVVEDAWQVRLPDMRTMLADKARRGLEDHDLNGSIRFAVDAGDLDGDELADGLIYEITPDPEWWFVFDSVRAVSGVDGAELWTADLGDAYDAFLLPVGDANSDGKDDLLQMSLSLPDGLDAGFCLFVCAIAADWQYEWNVSLISGGDGTAAWSKSFEGRITAGVAGAGALLAGAYAFVGHAPNALVIPFPGTDGSGSMVIDAIDLSYGEALEFASALVAGQLAYGWLYLFDTRAEVVRPDGTVAWRRVSSGSPVLSYLLPAGDLNGDGDGDHVWVSERIASTPLVCAWTLLVSSCSYFQTAEIAVEALNGPDGSTLWHRSVTGDGDAYAYVRPLDTDTTGDAKDDLLVTILPTMGYDSRGMLVSGGDGATAWTAEEDLQVAFIAGEIGGDSGPDLIALALSYDDDYRATVSVTRVDGATGGSLLRTERTFGEPGTWSDAIAYPFGDADADGVVDVGIEAYTEEYDPDVNDWSYTTHTQILSGSEDELIRDRSIANDFISSLPGGDLDADGTTDAIDIRTEAHGDTVSVHMDAFATGSGATLWQRTDRLDASWDAYVVIQSTADQRGDGTGDLLYSLGQVEPTAGWETRIEGVDGPTGSAAWSRGNLTVPPAPGTLRGTVTNESGEAVAGICVDAYDLQGWWMGYDLTDSTGSFAITLRAQTYYIGFVDCADGSYASEWYEDKSSIAEADPIAVSSGASTSIAAVLADFSAEPPDPEEPPAPPANDNFANAHDLTGTIFAEAADTYASTVESGEPAPCGQIGSTVWYRYVAPKDGQVAITTAGSWYDTVVAVYEGGALDTLNMLACNDDSVLDTTFYSTLTFEAEEGTAYYVQAGGFDGDNGQLRISGA